MSGMSRFSRFKLVLAVGLLASILASGPISSAAIPRVIACSAAGKLTNTFGEGAGDVGLWGVSLSAKGSCTGAFIDPMQISVTSLYGTGCFNLNYIYYDPCVDWYAAVRVTLVNTVTGVSKSHKQVWHGLDPAAFLVSRPGLPASIGAGSALVNETGGDRCGARRVACYPATFIWAFPFQP